MSQQASPRGTFLKIADAVKTRVEADPDMTELPSAADLMRDYKVSRGVALRAFGALQKEGVAEPVPGGRWRVVRPGERADRRPLDARIAAIIADEGLAVGAPFPSASVLAARFGVSRPTVTKALDKLEAAGVLASGGQGKARTVRAVPIREERS
ncbi:GntR family transcriptional regulator [Streptomyces ficellus]|uniref:GntR family transcriptional regulator n=1 Tax=Streptomyces ficellus TaxID=1977088 RepID=A0ABT7Z1Y6_9ACTN|nr:GntR family transcriptional regulator [Streptomyces ficellus]MDN3293498.1 GntR family transcriptional regulator [Streptomyces ficellus]